MKQALVLASKGVRYLGLLKGLLKKVNRDILISTYYETEKAFQFTKEYRIDLFLIDLSEEKKKIDKRIMFAKRIRSEERDFVTPILFLCTRGVQKDLVDFCDIGFCHFLNPYIQKEKLYTVMQRILVCHHYNNDVIVLKNSRRYVEICPEEFVYAEMQGRKLWIHTTDDVISFPYMSLKEFLKRTEVCGVLQCHRSFAVNRRFIQYVNMKDGSVVLKFSYGVIDLGKGYSKKLLEELEAGGSKERAE